MKLRLPHQLLHSLMACICSVASLSTTVATGTLAGGAVILAVSSGLAQAADIVVSDTDTETDGVQAGDIAIESGTNTITVNEDATANKIDGAEGSYTKLGDGTLTVTSAPMSARPTYATISEGTLVIQYRANWGGGFVSNTATVEGGATLKLDYENALGADVSGTRGCTAIILNGGEATGTATLDVAKSTRLYYDLQLNGYASVEGDGGITAYGGSSTITVTNTNNSISTDITLSNVLTISVAEAAALDFSGIFTSASTGKLTKTGAGELTLSGGTAESVSTLGGGLLVSAGSVVNNGELALSGSFSVEDGASFINNGALTLQGTTSLYDAIVMGADGSLTLAPGALIDLSNLTADTSVEGVSTYTLLTAAEGSDGSNLDLSSLLSKSNLTGYGSTLGAWTFNTDGTISFTAGETIEYSTAGNTAAWAADGTGEGVFTNGDAIAVTAGDTTATLEGDISAYSIAISADAALTISGSNTLTVENALTNSGTLTIGSDTTVTKYTPTSGSVLMVNEGNTFTITDTSDYPLMASHGNLWNILSSGKDAEGNISAGTVILDGDAGFDNNVSNPQTVYGNYIITGDFHAGNGGGQLKMTIGTGSSLRVLDEAVLENDQHITVSGAGSVFSAGTLVMGHSSGGDYPASLTIGEGAVVTLQNINFRNTYDKNYIELVGGRLNLGTGSFTYKNNTADAKHLKLTSGTLSTTADSWTYALDTAIGTITFDTTKQNYDATTGLSTAGTTGATMTLSGAVTAAEGFTVTGAGALALTGDILGGGGIAVNGGELKIGSGSSSSTGSLVTGDITLASGTTLSIDHADGTMQRADGSLANLTMQGATLHNYDTTNSDGGIQWGTLTLSGDNTLEYTYKGTQEFTGLTGADATATKLDIQVNTNQWGLTGESHKTILNTVENFNGSITQTIAEGYGHTLYINNVSQAAGYAASVGGASSSADGFVKTGDGSISLENHTAEGSMRVESGTLNVGALTLNSGASLELAGGTLSLGSIAAAEGASPTVSLLGGTFGTAEESLTTDLAVTLGAVTLGSAELAGDIILSGDIHFTNKVTTNVALTLAGDISLSTEAMANTKPEDVSYSYNGTSGYLSGTYTLVTGNGDGSVSLAGTLNDDGSKTITVGNTTAELTASNGTASFTLKGDTSGTYYVNESMSYTDDKTVTTSTDEEGNEVTTTTYNMASAATLYVNSGATLTFASQDWTKNLDLAGGTVAFKQGSMNPGSGAIDITLHSTTNAETGEITYSQNTISMGNSTMGSVVTIDGTGNLTLEKNSSGVFYLLATIQHEGDLTLSGGVLMGGQWQNGAGSINNTGKLTLLDNSIHYGYAGNNVTAIELKNGTLETEGNRVTHNIVSTATSGTYTNKVYVSGASNPMVSSISGDGNLTIEVASGYELHFYSDASALDADLTLSGSGTINIGHSGSTANPTLTHSGDLIIDGATVSLADKADEANRTTIANGGNLVLKSGKLFDNTSNNWGSSNAVITLAGEADGAGRIIIEGGEMTLTRSSVTAKGLELTGGTLTLGTGITLTGGVTDADGNAVDTLVLTGGTLTAAANISLGYSATLGGVTLTSGTYTVSEATGNQVDSGEVDESGNAIMVDEYADVTKYYALTLGAEGTTTTITGTVQNNANLTLNGTLKLTALDESTKTNEVTRTEGENGYSYATYTLVNGAEGSALTLGTDKLLVEGYADATLTVNGGSATFVTGESTYHVAKDTVAYSAITGNEQGMTFKGIAMEGGTLSVAAGESVSQLLNVTAESFVSGAAETDGVHAGIAGGISGTADITINSAATSASTNNQHGDYFALSGDINLGSANLIIGSGVVRLGNTDEDTPTDSYELNAANIVVKNGATFEIYRKGGDYTSTGLTLEGGTLRVQQVNGDANLNLGTLTVSAASAIDRNSHGKSVTFTALTGAGDLTLTNSGTTTIGKLDAYTGKLTLSAGTLNFTDKLTISGSSIQIDGGALRAEQGLEMTGGELIIAGGSLAGKDGAALTSLELTGGKLTAATTVTLSGDMTLGNVTLASNTYTVTAEDDTTGTAAYAITLGNNGTTTFTGTVTNAGALTLGGALVVGDLAGLDVDGETISYGQSGYTHGTYSLVKVEDAAAAQDGETFTPTLTLTNSTVTVAGETKDITVSGGTATFSYVDDTYHVAADVESVAYSSITATGVTFSTISLDGGVLAADDVVTSTPDLDADGNELGTTTETLSAPTIKESISLTADSAISATGTQGATISGSISVAEDATGNTLTLNGTNSALTVTDKVTVGAVKTTGTVNLTGNVSASSITVNSGTTMFGETGGKSTNTLGVSELVVNKGATLAISRWASSVTGEAFTTAPNLTLNDGTLHMQAMEGSSSTAGLVFGTLTVTGDSYVTSEWSHTTFFNELTGTGDLNIAKFSNADGHLWGETTYMGINSLTDYEGTLTMADSSEMKLYLLSTNQGANKSGTVVGTTYSSAADGSFTKLGEGALALDKHVAEGSFTVQAGTLSVNMLTLGTVTSTSSTDEEGNTTTSTLATSTGNVVLNGGALNIGTGGIGTVTADDMSGVTSTITLAGGTLGATGEGWSTALATTVTGSATINTSYTTTVDEVETTAGATITMGDITVEGSNTLNITGAGSVTAGAVAASGGTLSIAGTAGFGVTGESTLGTVNNSGTLTIGADTTVTTYDAYYEGSIALANGAKLDIATVKNVSGDNFTGKRWWNILTATGDGSLVINQDVNTSGSTYSGSYDISADVQVKGNVTFNAWGGTVDVDVQQGASLSVTGTMQVANNQTLNAAGDLTVGGQLSLGENPSYSGYLNITGGTTTLTGGLNFATGGTTYSPTASSLTLNGGSLILGADITRSSDSVNYSINLASGTLGASADWSTALDVTLGSASGLTIASGTRTETTTVDGVESTSTVANTITLSGTTTFGGTVENTGNLVLSGTLKVDAAALANMTHGEQTYSYNGVSGFLGATYTLVSGGENASLTFGTNEDDSAKTSTTITVGSDSSNTFDVTAANGGATFTGHNGVYYVNADMARTDDSTAMGSATSIYVKDSTLTFNNGDWSKQLILSNASFTQSTWGGQGSLGSGSSVLLEGGNNKITATNSTMRAHVTGTGNLTLTNAGGNVFNLNATVEHEGNLELNGVTVQNGATIANKGTLGVTSDTTTLQTNNITVEGVAFTGGTVATTVDQTFGVDATLGNVTLKGTATTTTTDAVVDDEGNIITEATSTTTYTNFTIGAEGTTTTFTGKVTSTNNNLALLGNFNIDSLAGFTEFTNDAGTEGTNGFRSSSYTLVSSDSAISLTEGATFTVKGEESKLTVSEDGTTLSFGAQSDVYYVATGAVTYGIAAEDGIDTARQFVLEGGTLNLASALAETVTGGISLTNAGTVSLAKDVTLTASQVALNGNTLTLTGSGTYVETAPGSGVVVAGAWDGLVQLSGTLTGTDLNQYGSAISSIELSGAAGYLKNGSSTYAMDVILTGTNEDGTGTAVTFNNGNNGDTHTFIAEVSGAGDIVRSGSAGTNQNFVFSGEMDEWTGAFIVNSANGATNVTFSGAAAVVQAGLVGNDASNALNVTFDNSGMTSGMAVSSAISGNVNVTYTGTGTTTFAGSYAENYTGTTTVAAGVLAVAEGSSLTSVSVADGAVLALSASADSTVNTIITGDGAVRKTGAGVLTLSALDSAFTGRLNVREGSMVLGTALNTSGLIVSGAGQLTFGAGSAVANLALVSGSTVVNSGKLTLTGEITVDLASLSRLAASDGAEYSFDSTGDGVKESGFRTGSYMLVQNNGGTDAIDISNATVRVNGAEGTLSLDSDGNVMLAAIDGTYYVNADMAYTQDESMAGAVNIMVTNSTLNLANEYDKSHQFVLSNGTLKQDTSSLQAGSTITLLEGTTNTLSMANSTMQATVTGTGDLVLERVTSSVDDYNDHFYISGTLANDGDITLTTAEGAEGKIVFKDGAVVANTGSVTVSEGTTMESAGADFSATDMVNYGLVEVSGDTVVNTYAHRLDVTTETEVEVETTTPEGEIVKTTETRTETTSYCGELSIDAGKSFTIKDISAYQFNESTNSKTETFWQLVQEGVSMSSGGGKVVLQTNATGTGLLDVDTLYIHATAAERALYGHFEVAGDLQVNNGGAYQEIIISGKTSSLTVTGDASFLSQQELFVSNGGALTVEGTLYLGHEGTAGNYYANLSVGTSSSALSSSATLGGLVFQNYAAEWTDADKDRGEYNYLRLGNGTLTFVDDGENKAQVTIGSHITDLAEGEVVARLELDGGPVKTATTGDGLALGWEVNKHIEVDIVNVGFDTTAGGTITFNGATEFWGTAGLTGIEGSGLELAGTISVLDYTTLTMDESVAPTDTNGFGEARYYLVKAETGSNATVTFGNDTTVREGVVVGGMEDTKTLTSDGGNVYFAEAGSVYHINVGMVDYATISQAALEAGFSSGSPTAISLDTAGVGLSLAGQTVTETTTELNGYGMPTAELSGSAAEITADVRVTVENATLSGGVNSVILGTLSMDYAGETPGTLTISSTVTNDVYERIATTSYLAGEGLNGVRPAFSLRGDIDLGSNDLVIDGGWVAFGEYHENSGHSTNTLKANSLTVNGGASLEIYHAGESGKDYVQLGDAGITLNGGRLFVRAIDTATGGSMNMGNLTVNNAEDGTAASLGWYWGGTLEFDSMTGAGNLNIMGPDGSTADAHGVTFTTVADYTGTMTVSKNAQGNSGANVSIAGDSFGGNIVLEHGSVTLGGEETSVAMTGGITVSGGTFSLSGESSAAGAISISGGSMDVAETASIASSTGVEISGGTLTLHSAANYGESAPAMTLSGSGQLNHNAAGASDHTLALTMKNGGVLDLYKNTVYGNITLASAEGEASSHVKGGGTVVGKVSGTGDLTVDYTTNADYHFYTADSATDGMAFDGDLIINSAGERGDGKNVWIGSEDGTKRTDISGSGKVQVNYGDLTLRQGSISKTEGVEVAATGAIKMGDGGKIYATATTQEAAAAIIGNQTSKWAEFSNGTITSDGISGFTGSVASLYQATVTVSNAFALENLEAKSTNFDIKAALGVKSGVTMDESSKLFIGTTGSVVSASEDATKLVVSGVGNTIALDAAQSDLITVGKEVSHTNAGLTCTVVTSTQLAGIDSTSTGSFTLDLSGDTFAALLAAKKDILLVFVDPYSTSLLEDEAATFTNGSLTFYPSATVGVDADYRVDTSIDTAVLSDLATGAGLTLANGMTAVYIKAAPEPTTSALSLLALAALAARRRRK